MDIWDILDLLQYEVLTFLLGPLPGIVGLFSQKTVLPLFTVLGGGIAGIVSLFAGFSVVFLIAMGVYLMALLAFAWARSRVASVVPRTIPEQPSELALTV